MILASTLETLLNPKVKKIWCREEFWQRIAYNLQLNCLPIQLHSTDFLFPDRPKVVFRFHQDIQQIISILGLSWKCPVLNFHLICSHMSIALPKFHSVALDLAKVKKSCRKQLTWWTQNCMQIQKGLAQVTYEVNSNCADVALQVRIILHQNTVLRVDYGLKNWSKNYLYFHN
jgi:hypothetical protein